MQSKCEGRPPNSIPNRYCELSASAKILVWTMQSVQYGRFLDLHVRNGDPVWSPPPRLIKVKRIGSAEEPTVPLSCDWLLKEPIIHLLREFAALGNGTIERLEFRQGLPCLLEIAFLAQRSRRAGAKSL